jgi:hypothetical protein
MARLEGESLEFRLRKLMISFIDSPHSCESKVFLVVQRVLNIVDDLNEGLSVLFAGWLKLELFSKFG